MNAVVKSFEAYNERRYGTPWVCTMTEKGEYNFDAKVGTYTGNGRNGEAGDLVVFEPVEGTVYGYGQKDYRGGKTLIEYAKWDGKAFAPCNKLGY